MNERECIVYDKYEALGYDIIRAGIPDLILLKDEKIKFIEVKSEVHKISEDQERAIELLEKHGFSVKIERVILNPPSREDTDFNSFMKSMTNRERNEYINLPRPERINAMDKWLSIRRAF